MIESDWLLAVRTGEVASVSLNVNGLIVVAALGVPVIAPADNNERPSVSVPLARAHV